MSRQVWIEALLNDLKDSERQNERLLPYLRPEGTFHVARSVKFIASDTAGEGGKFEISQHYCKPMPIFEWLQESNINGSNTVAWWNNRDQLKVDGISFVDYLGATSRPTVGVWKEKAAEFAEQYLRKEHYEEVWTDNPQGYAGVLKGTLPHFVFVPAVRDISDETKATKTNPFGQLLYALIDNVSEQQKNELKDVLSDIEKRLNRTGGAYRYEIIVSAEDRLNELLKDYMPCQLEIEFQAPTLETLLTTPKLFADDGFRNVVSNKGHGLQRAIIFTILRCYSELVTGRQANKKRTMIFAVEEPELYMHPQAQRTIRRTFHDICKAGDQVIFSTHSALLLDVAFFDEIIRVEALQDVVDEKKQVESKVWQVAIENMIDDIKIRHPHVEPTVQSLRELYSNAYHPNRSEGFFAKKVILVEGPTEQYALPIYADAAGYPLDNLNISVVDAGGKGPMDRLYRIFNEMGIPCYILFDYDKSSSDSEMLKKSRELLEMVGESPNEPSTVIIKDRIACFPNNWEVDLVPETPGYDNLREEAKRELGLKEDTGKPLIARYMARKLTSRESPYIPLSLKDIIEKAVHVEWAGSCLAC